MQRARLLLVCVAAAMYISYIYLRTTHPTKELSFAGQASYIHTTAHRPPPTVLHLLTSNNPGYKLYEHHVLCMFSSCCAVSFLSDCGCRGRPAGLVFADPDPLAMGHHVVRAQLLLRGVHGDQVRSGVGLVDDENFSPFVLRRPRRTRRDTSQGM